MSDKPTEMAIVTLRRADKAHPAELIIGDRQTHSIYVLRSSQLKQLAYDAVTMALDIK